jgi:hypothetical protein
VAVGADSDAEEGIVRKKSEESTDWDSLAVQWLVAMLLERGPVGAGIHQMLPLSSFVILQELL